MKTCAKCGNANFDEAVFCSSCGTPLEQAPAAPQQPVAPMPAAIQQFNSPQQPIPPQPAFVPPVYTAPAETYSAPASSYQGPDLQTKNSATLWLILNIVALILCCPGFLFSGIGIVFAALGMGSYNKGDYEGMKQKSKISMWLFIVGAVLGLLGLILSVVIWIVYKNSGY